MEIYSLSGASGTGKSTSALQFAHNHHIHAIIDDGLLIIDGEKVAGTSAKFEKSVLRAVRRAIFDEEAHRTEVLNALQKFELPSILLIGTSTKMTKKIAERLALGQIKYFYKVEDVRSEKDIERARFVREIQGQHLMPVPFRQVEQNFFKRFIQRGMDIIAPNRVKIGETTLVRPDFHQQTITIAKSVYTDIVKHVVESNSLVTRIQHLQCIVKQVPRISFEIYLAAPVNYSIPEQILALQQAIANSFSVHFHMEPEQINIHVIGIERKTHYS
ncbi:hypothetical protein LZ480_12215 [Solibacillus sp. MA9]|uniref:ATP-binding protein n=1 Tax=Solibacillus palustris TaxID=2908203 RepID=A0ABS9UE96_9BACL|nr:hypothetical protein [Solibacillus sp. MA9]MCH7322657.1 hypothetical protein [Solibacillus sp. MA9]